MTTITLFCGAVFLVASLIISVLLSLEILIEGERKTWTGQFVRWVRTRDQMDKIIFLVAASGAVVVILLYWYSYPPDGFKDFLQGITAEIAGGMIDLAVVGVIIGIYENRKKTREQLYERERAEQEKRSNLEKRSREEIADGIAVKNEEGKVNVWRGIERLNEIEVYDINLNFADLSNSTPQIMGKDYKAIVRDGSLFRTVITSRNLADSEFTDCKISESIFENSTLLRVKFDDSTLQHCSFKNAKCQLASFKNAVFSGKTNFSGAVLTTTSFTGAIGQDINFDGCEVRADFREKVRTWKIDTGKFFKDHVLISRHEPFRHHPDGSVKDVVERWYISNMTRFVDDLEFFMHTHAENTYSLEQITIEEE